MPPDVALRTKVSSNEAPPFPRMPMINPIRAMEPTGDDDPDNNGHSLWWSDEQLEQLEAYSRKDGYFFNNRDAVGWIIFFSLVLGIIALMLLYFWSLPPSKPHNFDAFP